MLQRAAASVAAEAPGHCKVRRDGVSEERLESSAAAGWTSSIDLGWCQGCRETLLGLGFASLVVAAFRFKTVAHVAELPLSHTVANFMPQMAA